MEEIKTKCRTMIKEKERPDNSSMKCIRERDWSVWSDATKKKARST